MTQSQYMIGFLVAICASVAVVPDDTTETDAVSDGHLATLDLTEDFQVTLQDSVTGELGGAMNDLVGVIADLALTVLDETISEDSVNAALEEAWTAQVEQHDTNQDGSLNRDEVSKIPDFRLDDDGNELSDEDFDALLDETFETLDLDKDGQITKAETRKYLSSLTSNVSEWIETAQEELKPELSPMFENDETLLDSESDQ